MHRFHLSVFLKWRPISLPHKDCIQVRLNSTYIRMYCAGSLTHWGRVTHIYVSDPTITGSDNGLSPRRRQAIIWTNAEILLIGPLGTNFNEILIEIHTFSFKKMHLKMSSVKWRPFCVKAHPSLECGCKQMLQCCNMPFITHRQSQTLKKKLYYQDEYFYKETNSHVYFKQFNSLLCCFCQFCCDRCSVLNIFH